MTSVPDPSPIHEAAALIRSRQMEKAAEVLIPFLKANPESEDGWFLLSFAVDDFGHKRECLEHLLQINPNHARAQARLSKLRSMADGSPSPVPDRKPSAKKAKSSGVLKWLVVGILGLALLGVGGYGIWQITQNWSPNLQAVNPGAPTQPAATAPVQETEASPTSTFLPPTPEPTAVPAEEIPQPAPDNEEPPPDDPLAQQMDDIQNQVSTLRGLGILTDGGRRIIPQAQVHGILNDLFRERYSRAEVEDEARVLSALGLVEPNYDLYSKIVNDMGEGLGGFYIPWTDELYVIGNDFSAVERFIYAHEYDHALVDQHYHLEDVGVFPECLQETDRCSAITALVEGDATALMYQWLGGYASEEDIAEIEEDQYAPIDKVITSSDFAPPYNLRDVNFKYGDGEVFVNYLYDLGGWGLVNEAYQNLPASTEQILHPEKYMSGEAPIQVEIRPLGDLLSKDWRLLTTETLGELTTQMILGYSANYLVQLDSETATNAAAGWGGDSYQVYYRGKSNQSILVAHWVWDSVPEATEFWEAMNTYLSKRYLNRKVEDASYDCWTKLNDHFSCVYRTQNNTLWLMAPTMELIDLLLDQYPEFR